MHESGFALAALIFFLTATSILIAVAIPSYQMQAKRVEEQELIFRGEEYMRAIQKFQRKFKTYPTSVDALLDTNGVRFLRRVYTDPVTGKPFRVIYVNSDGSLSGSVLFNQTMNNGQSSAQPATSQNPVVSQFYTQQVAQTQYAGQNNTAGSANPASIAGWVIGVASESKAESLMAYNGRRKYKEWEFIAILQPAQQNQQPQPPPAKHP